MPKSSKFTIQTPAVRALFAGVHVECKGKFTYRYFRLTKEGKAEAVPLSKQLVALGMSAPTATILIKRAIKAGLIRQATGTETEPVEDQDETQLAPYQREQQERLAKRFQLTKSVSRNGVYWGVFDSDFDTEELISESKSEALAEIERRIAAAQFEKLPLWMQFRTGVA